MHCKIIQHIPYSQGRNIGDIKAGGRCFAYVALYFSYISTYLFRNLPIDYSAINAVLDKTPEDVKNDLMTVNEDIDKYRQKLAILNQNMHEGESYEQPFKAICEEILDQANDYESVFYFIRYVDYKQTVLNHPLRHIVGIYLAKPGQIHFFDSNSGTYILELPPTCTVAELQEDLIELMFKRNLFFKWFFTPDSETMEFELIRSYFVSDYLKDTKGKQIFECLEKFFQDPMQDTAFLQQMDFDKLTLDFIERHIFALRMQYQAAQNNNNATPGYLDQFTNYASSLMNNLSNLFSSGSDQQPQPKEAEEKNIPHQSDNNNNNSNNSKTSP